MFGLETVILYLTIVIVTINGQSRSLTFTPPMTVTLSTVEGTNTAANAYDGDSMTAPATCAVTTAAAKSRIAIDLKGSYSIYSITIANKPISGSITTTANSGLNQGTGTDGMRVHLFYPDDSTTPATSAGTGFSCSSVSPGTTYAPFGTITATRVTATFTCSSRLVQYILLAGPGTVGAALCAFTITLKDEVVIADPPIFTFPTIIMFFTNTTTVTVRNGSRYVRFDWSIIIAMLLAAAKVTINNDRY